jgi:hypothetical protein
VSGAFLCGPGPKIDAVSPHALPGTDTRYLIYSMHKFFKCTGTSTGTYQSEIPFFSEPHNFDKASTPIILLIY